jgi:hypothetical protein
MLSVSGVGPGENIAMDHRRFDRVTSALVAESGRRRAIGGLLAGAAVLGQRASAPAKKRKKKKCTHCPQRACCSCRSVIDGPATKCITFEGVTSINDAQDLCIDFCGSLDLLFKFNFLVPNLANFCRADFDCTVKQCPVKVKA